MGYNNDLAFFNQVKRLTEEDGVSWKDSGDGFLWGVKDSIPGVVAWLFYLHADEIKIIIAVNGFQKGAISLDEIHLMRLYKAVDGKGATVSEITKDDWKSMMSFLYNETVKAMQFSKKT